MDKVLVTGFTPFAGRQKNASWELAATIDHPAVTVLEVPVIWGSPLPLLRQYCDRLQPNVILSFGEGREGWFDLEMRARRCRGSRADESGKTAMEALICSGPVERQQPHDWLVQQRSLTQSGWPVRVSRDAGQYLCEEMLYSLLSLAEELPYLDTVSFCHLPPFQTPVLRHGTMQSCNAALLADYAADFLKVTTDCRI